MKHFFITIDTEGDNLWEYTSGKINTENVKFIPRFQELAQKYNFKPVYLVNYEIIENDFFCEYANKLLKDNFCEIGIHPHAWNSPPLFDLEGSGKGLPYLIEYPKDIMNQKFDYLYNAITEKFNVKPVSHRSGRWALNQDYIDILIEHDIKIDCSVTPFVSWKRSMGHSAGGSDYSKNSSEPYKVKHSKNNNAITEIPVTIRKFPFFLRPVWIRPNGKNLSKMLKLCDYIKKSKSQYLMFMLHSSELMPKGSPTFSTNESIEKLYNDLEILFKHISHHFKGITLKDYHALSLHTDKHS
ncbi:MAG: hypothetical protein FWD28_00130 [Treponema sp.]|nr:hypothetical protein [Treponema sp.]